MRVYATRAWYVTESRFSHNICIDITEREVRLLAAYQGGGEMALFAAMQDQDEDTR